MEREDGKTWRNWLTHNLPTFINRDPQAIPAITLTPPSDAPGLVVIRDHTLFLPGPVPPQYYLAEPTATSATLSDASGDGGMAQPLVGTFDLTQYELGTLCQALQAQQWGAVLSPGIPADLAATALVDTGTSALSPVPVQDVAAYPALCIPSSVAWTVLRPLAQTWEGLTENLTSLLLGILEGPWLDNLGTYLQIPRIGGEPDSLYQTRLYGLAITGSPNGVAMEAFFAALGYSVAMANTTPAQFTATVQWPTQPPQGFVYSQSDLQSMIDTLKAVGVIATVIFASGLSDTLSLSDTVTVSQPPTAVWGGSGTTGFTYNQATWN